MKFLALLVLGFAFLQAEDVKAPATEAVADESWVAVADEEDADAEIAAEDSAKDENCGCPNSKKG